MVAEQAEALLQQAAASASRGDARAAVMQLFHAAGAFEAAAASLAPFEAEAAAVLRERAALCRQHARELQTAAPEADATATQAAPPAVPPAAPPAAPVEPAHAPLQIDPAERPSPVAMVAGLGALAAFCAVGPVTAVVAAAATVATARRNDGLGAATRATGDFAADAVAAARAFDRTHGISCKVALLAERVKERTGEAEQKLKETHPHAAAALGTATRVGGMAVRSSSLGMAASAATLLQARATAAADSAARAADTAARAAAVVDGVHAKAAAVKGEARRLLGVIAGEQAEEDQDAEPPLPSSTVAGGDAPQ